MARAANKNDLLQDANENYQKLMELINSFTKEEQEGTFPFEDRDHNIRDVLIHLHEWHNLLLNWVASNQKGIEKQFLQEGYNWKTYGAMNVGFWEKHQGTSYQEALDLLNNSHNQVLKLIEEFSNDELFTKKVFKWVGGSVLGSYFVSATASHYDWAIKKLKKYKKELKTLD